FDDRAAAAAHAPAASGRFAPAAADGADAAAPTARLTRSERVATHFCSAVTRAVTTGRGARARHDAALGVGAAAAAPGWRIDRRELIAARKHEQPSPRQEC